MIDSCKNMKIVIYAHSIIHTEVFSNEYSSKNITN